MGTDGRADGLGAEGLAEQLLESMMDSFAEYKEFVSVNFLSGLKKYFCEISSLVEDLKLLKRSP